MLGRYLDQLPDHLRDRVIEGQGWCAGAAVDEADNRCLVGHIEQWTVPAGASVSARRPADRGALRKRHNWEELRDIAIPDRFDDLADRFGLDRIVALVKARAAKVNAIRLPATVEAL